MTCGMYRGTTWKPSAPGQPGPADGLIVTEQPKFAKKKKGLWVAATA